MKHTQSTHEMNMSKEKLGVNEFRAALNRGNDAAAIPFLRRFARTVRKERCRALLSTEAEDTDENDDSAEDDTEDGPSSKRSKAEAWKQDTNEYNVPFVGTAIFKGDTGAVVPNTWPTGFLAAYLQASPEARELCSFSLTRRDDSNAHGHKNRKTEEGNQTLHIAFVDALGELLTVGVPIRRLREDLLWNQGLWKKSTNKQSLVDDNDGNMSFDSELILSTVMKNYFPALLSLLNQEKGSVTDKKRRCSTTIALHVLGNLTMTSMGAAREIARGLDSVLNEGVLRTFIQGRGVQRANIRKYTKNTKQNNDDVKRSNEQRSTKKSPNARTECFRLACTLIEANDLNVVSFVAAPGNKERKLNPGIMFLALRSLESSEIDPCMVIRFLKGVRLVIYGQNGSERRRGGTLNNRILADLLHSKPLDYMSYAAAHAPALTQLDSYLRVIEGVDNEDVHSTQEAVAIECRRLLFVLLSDKTRSPFLLHMNSSGSSDAKAESYAQQLTRALYHLKSSSQYNLPTRDFIVHCLQTTPYLLPRFFRAISVGEPSPSFQCLSDFSFIAHLMHAGPSAWSSSLNNEHCQKIKADQWMAYIVPTALSKNIMSKAVQSPNALLVVETLKLIVAILQRATKAQNDLAERISTPILFSDALRRRLPDLQALLAIRSRFDPFPSASESPLLANSIVLMSLCEVLQLYVIMLPAAVQSAKFDWTKLLPDSADDFFRASAVLQCRILKTVYLLATSHSDESHGRHGFSSKAFHIVFALLFKAPNETLYDLTREIAITAVTQIIQQTELSTEAVACLKYEASLWVDGASDADVSVLIKLFDVAQKNPVQHSMLVAKAWSQRFSSMVLKEITFSVVLSTALASLSLTLYSTNFVKQVCKVAFKMLLYQTDPILLAVLITHLLAGVFHDFENGDSDEQKQVTIALKHLYEFASSLVDKDGGVDVQKITATAFGKDNFHSLLSSMTTLDCSDLDKEGLYEDKLNTRCDTILATVILRQCQHHQVHNTRFPRTTSLLQRVKQNALVTCLQGSDESAWRAILNPLFGHTSVLSDLPTITLILIALSSPKRLELPIEFSPLDKIVEDTIAKIASFIEGKDAGGSHDAQLRHSFLLTAAVGPMVPSAQVANVVSQLLHSCADFLSLADSLDGQRASFALLWKFLVPSNIVLDSNFPIGAVFDCWTQLARSIQKGQYDTLTTGLCFCLENILAKALVGEKVSGVTSCRLFVRICQFSPELVVSLAFSILSHKDNGTTIETHKFAESLHSATGRGGCSHVSLLVALVKYDAAEFARFVVEQLVNLDDKQKIFKQLHNDKYDDLMITLFYELKRQERCNEVMNSFAYAQISKAAVMRLTCFLKHAVNEELAFPAKGSFKNAIDCLSSFYELARLDAELLEDLWLSASRYLQRKATKFNHKSLALYEMAIIKILVTPLSNTCELDQSFVSYSASWKLFCSTAFLFLCETLTYYIRQKKVKSDDKVVTCTGILTSLQTIVAHFACCDKNAVEKGAEIIEDCVIACLKHGIVSIAEESQVSAYCLQFVRNLLTIKFSSPTCNLFSGIGILDLSNVHTVVTMHSKFRAALSSVGFDSDLQHKATQSNEMKLSVKLELIRLLLCCVSLGTETIKVERDTWSAVLEGNTASPSLTDTLLRRLLYLYEALLKKQDESIDFCNMCELRWASLQQEKVSMEQGGYASIAGGDGLEQWEWLIEGLELRRVRYTLTRFPIMDELEPLPDESELCNNLSTKVSPSNEDFDDNESQTSALGADIDDAIDDSPHISTTWKRGKSRSENEWQIEGPDKRYSTAFILPLILATLESFLPPGGVKKFFPELVDERPNTAATHKVSSSFHSRHKEVYMLDKTNEDPGSELKKNQRERFAAIAYRLSCKGAISLSLATLSAKCPRLRQVAVSVVFLFLQAIHTKEAHDLKKWRERPQLAMVLDSVQRGLSVRRAMQLCKKSNGPPLDTSRHVLIPMLPAVSAVFLGRASLILMNPDDEMFGPMNRFFLRLEHHHGAYTDVSSLPAFMSLYCSAAEDYSQARRERLWALQLLKDGTLDGYCYKVTSRRHVPELLLTSFNSLTSRSTYAGADELEISAVVDTIQILLKHGSRNAQSHLLTRVGLMSWLRQMIDMGSLSTINCSFLQLVSTAVTSALCLEGEDDVSTEIEFEMVNLARSILGLFADSYNADSALQRDNSKTPEISTEFHSVICDCLWSIRTTLKTCCDVISIGPMSRLGIPLEHCLSFLLCSEQQVDSLHHKVVGSLCFLPVDVDETQAAAAVVFCRKILLVVSRRDVAMDRTVFLDIITRATILGDFFRKCICWDQEIVSSFFLCRPTAMAFVGGMDAWTTLLTTWYADAGENENSGLELIRELIALHVKDAVPEC